VSDRQSRLDDGVALKPSGFVRRPPPRRTPSSRYSMIFSFEKMALRDAVSTQLQFAATIRRDLSDLRPRH
jgi:hypothetical protein